MKTIYYGNSFFIITDEKGNYFFEDDSSICHLKHNIKNPSNIIWDEHRGWIYKNGKNLPWAD